MKAPSLLLALALAVAPGGAAFAQSAANGSNEDWKWNATVYMLGASLDGTTGVNNLTADIDVGFDEILDNLEFGAMGRIRAARGHWSFGLDLIYWGSVRPPINRRRTSMSTRPQPN